MYHNVEPVGIGFGCGGSQVTEGTSQPKEGATQPTEPLLFPCPPVTCALLNDPTNEASNSTFGDGSDLHKDKYFGNKK